MVRTEKLTLAAGGIVAGGLLLGAALGSLANPVPKTPADPMWAGMVHPQSQDSAEVSYVSASSTPYLPDSYPPPRGITQPLAWWPADLRLPRGGEYKPEPWPSVKDDARLANVPDTFADRDVAIPHYAAIEKAARQAQDTARDADAAGQEPVEQAQSAPAEAPKVVYVAEQDDR